MPATRIAKNPTKLRPERFISHEAYSNYLPLNLVAKRAELLSDPNQRRLLYFLQNQSLQTGGLSVLSSELAEQFNMDATQLQCELERLCLDPDFGFKNITGSRDLVVVIEKYRQKLNKTVSHDLAETSIKRQIFDCLDYALDEKAFVIIEGDSRMGKTVSAQNWCEQHQGEAIYIKLEPCADEKSFFRTIARAIGTSYSAGRKSIEIRHRIEDALHLTKQLLVIDEAHYIHNLARRPSSEPRKLEWLRSSLIDKGVPIALISTPQWDQRIASAESVDWMEFKAD